MAHSLFLRIYYQSQEEVLQSEVMYFAATAPDEIDIDAMHLLAQEFSGAVQADWSNIMAAQVIFWGVEILIPRQVLTDVGPWRYQYNTNFKSTFVGAAMPDSVSQNINIEGVNTDDEPVVGGIRLAGLPQSRVDCSVLDAAQIAALETFMDNVFPAIWQISTGEQFTRVILHKPFTIDEEIVVAPNRSVPVRSGSRINRVLNRTQCKHE